MSVNPEKRAFFQILREHSKQVAFGKNQPLTVVDAASAGFKNRYLFANFIHYVGIDIDAEALLMGLERYPDDYAVLADISRQPIGSAFAELVVSTNTIENIKSDEAKLRTVKILSLALKDDADFILSIPKEHLSEDIVSFFNNNFKKITYSYHYSEKLTLIKEMTMTMNRIVCEAAIKGNFFAKVVWKILNVTVNRLLQWHAKRGRYNREGKRVVLIVGSGFTPVEDTRVAVFPSCVAIPVQKHFWRIPDTAPDSHREQADARGSGTEQYRNSQPSRVIFKP